MIASRAPSPAFPPDEVEFAGRRRDRQEPGMINYWPDGRRRRRHSANEARRRWYAVYRSWRFRRRFGSLSGCEFP
jgi:hypothetical protein